MTDRIRAIFSKEDGADLGAFNDLLTTVGSGKVCYNKENKEVSKEDANEKIRQVMFEVLEIPDGTKGPALRKAIRKHQNEVFEVIEVTLQDMINTGWGDNPFFNEYVERKSLAFGDTNEFVTEDKTILSVSELSGGHWNIIRQRLGAGDTFSVKTSWLGFKYCRPLVA